MSELNVTEILLWLVAGGTTLISWIYRNQVEQIKSEFGKMEKLIDNLSKEVSTNNTSLKSKTEKLQLELQSVEYRVQSNEKDLLRLENYLHSHEEKFDSLKKEVGDKLDQITTILLNGAVK